MDFSFCLSDLLRLSITLRPFFPFSLISPSCIRHLCHIFYFYAHPRIIVKGHSRGLNTGENSISTSKQAGRQKYKIQKKKKNGKELEEIKTWIPGNTYVISVCKSVEFNKHNHRLATHKTNKRERLHFTSFFFTFVLRLFWEKERRGEETKKEGWKEREKETRKREQRRETT